MGWLFAIAMVLIVCIPSAADRESGDRWRKWAEDLDRKHVPPEKKMDNSMKNWLASTVFGALIVLLVHEHLYDVAAGVFCCAVLQLLLIIAEAVMQLKPSESPARTHDE